MSSSIRNYKLVLLGNSAVGKSCLVLRFTRDQFLEFQEPTIGAAFSIATVEVDNMKIRFEIWSEEVGDIHAVYTSFQLSKNQCSDIVNEITHVLKNPKSTEPQNPKYLDDVEVSNVQDLEDDEGYRSHSMTWLLIDDGHVNVQLAFLLGAELVRFCHALQKEMGLPETNFVNDL